MQTPDRWPPDGRIPSRKRAGFLALLVTGLLAATASQGLDPRKAITQLSHISWQTDEGLPQNTVRAVAQTPDGYLWIGTQAGLVRFDGAQFKVYDRRTDGAVFKNDHIYTLAIDTAGDLWIGTNGGGLIRRREGLFELFEERHGLPSGRITALAPAADGSLWIGTYGGGIARLEGRRIDVFGLDEGLSHPVVFDLDLDTAGDLWIGTFGGGLNRLRDGTFESFTTTDGLVNNYVWAVHPGREGDLWIGTNGGLQRRLRDGTFESFTTSDGLSHNRVISLLEDRDGALWAGTYGGGLNRWFDGTFTHLDQRQGLSSDYIWTLYQDHEGTLWAGTLGGGLNQLKDGPFTTYSTDEGLASALPSCFFEEPDGALWIGTRSNGLNRFSDGEFEHHTTATGLSSNNIWTLAGDRQGVLWVGTTGGGISRWHGDRWSHLTTQDGLADDSVFALAEDRHGALWIGTNKGLNRYDHGRFEYFSDADGLASNQVRTFLEDRRGHLWIGTTGGISRFDGESFQTFSTADGLSSNNVWSIYEDKDDNGVLWLATSGGGLNRLVDGSITVFSTREGLFDNDLTTVLEDHAGYLWLGSSRGAFRVAKQNLLEAAADRTLPLDLVAYGHRDGMKTGECYGGDPAGIRTRDGRLWFSTLDGVAVVDPASIEIVPAPNVLLEEILVDGTQLAQQPTPLPPDGKLYEFHFTAPTLLVPGKIRLRYRLLGFDDKWIPSGQARKASYNNLDPGQYTFTAMASDEHGRWTGTSSSFDFTIRPAFHQTLTFYLLCGIAVTLAGYGLNRLQVQSLRRREKRLESRVEEALTNLKVLSGLLPICSACKKVRDDRGYWKQLETYIDEHSEASFSHGVCPTCLDRYRAKEARRRTAVSS